MSVPFYQQVERGETLKCNYVEKLCKVFREFPDG